jgi:hypothetical protein
MRPQRSRQRLPDQLYGVDATLRWKPLRRSICHSLILRSEFIWSLRQQTTVEQRAFGFYDSVDYQLGRRWFLGGHYDRSDRSRFDTLTDSGGSLVLTYAPAEFSRMKGQYRFTRYANGVDANELLMQVQFSLGAPEVDTISLYCLFLISVSGLNRPVQSHAAAKQSV